MLAALDAGGIAALVIKGSALARDVYQDPNRRASADIDILIRISDAALREAGWLRTDGRPLGFWLSRLHHARYGRPDQTGLVEVHWNFGIPGFFRLDSETIWEQVLTAHTRERNLSPEMVLILLLIHHHMHFLREFKILVDIVWAFHRYAEQIDWHTFSEILDKIGLVKIARLSLNQIRSLWPELILRHAGMKTLGRELKNYGPNAPAF